MPVKDIVEHSAEPVVDNDGNNLMALHYKDEQFNAYDEGPGANLLPELQTAAFGNEENHYDRKKCGIYLRHVPKVLTKGGLQNLCNKYGVVVEVRLSSRDDRTENVATVQFQSIADAQNAMTNINQLRKEKNGKMRGIVAEFQRIRSPPKRQVEQIDDSPLYESPNDILKEYDYPMQSPACIDSLEPKRLITEKDVQYEMLRDFDNQETTTLLETFKTITNGCRNYRYSAESEVETSTKKTTLGLFDEKMQEFTHNAQLAFSVSSDCKNCGNCTIKFCKGCKEFFCSLFCLKQYNREKSGCSCVSSKSAPTRLPNRVAVGRGARLLDLSRVVSPTLSDTLNRSTSSSVSDIGNAEPCDLPSNNESVVIVRVVSHKIVFLRSYDQKYEKYLNNVAAWGKIAPSLDETPKPGDIVAAEFEGCFYRAMIARIDNDEAVVAFLELGNLEKKPIDGLKKLRADLQYVKRFIFKANLCDVGVDLKNDKCLAYLYKLLDRGTELKFIRKANTSDGIQCELFEFESVNEKLMRLNNIKADTLVTYDDIPVKLLDAGETQVVVIDNTFVTAGLVTVVALKNTHRMFLMHQRIQEYGKEPYDGPYAPQPNEICLAKCNDQWYRVKLNKSFGDMNPAMKFIDFFCYNTCNVNDMRPMPAEFSFPQYCLLAEISGITNETDMEALSKHLPILSQHVVRVENAEKSIIKFDLKGMAEKVEAPIPVLRRRLDLLTKLRKNN